MTPEQLVAGLIVCGACWAIGWMSGAQAERNRWADWFDKHETRGRDLPRPPFGTITEDLDDDDDCE